VPKSIPSSISWVVKADALFVMTMQMIRAIAVLFLGPRSPSLSRAGWGANPVPNDE